MTSPVALEMIGISKRFGAVAALDDASLVVHRGTVHALLGENGAGKTTLMRLAYGMLEPDRGTIRIDGALAQLDAPAAAISRGVGMVHQHPANVPAMTVAENLQLGGRGAYRRHSVRAAAVELANRVGFAVDVDARVETLSVAAQQRLEILKAIGRNAKVLIFDEPTAVLAPSEARELLEWLRTFAAGGGTAIVITHKLQEARSYADALTVLRRGRTVFTRHSKDTRIDELAEAMIGEATSPAAPHVRHQGGDIVADASGLMVSDDRGTPAIRSGSFDVRRAEVVGIVGVEGSGHHELLLALAGRIRPTGGTLNLPEQIGFVPEDRHRDGVVLDYSLLENVAIQGAGSRRGTMPWRSIENRTSALIAAFDIRARGARDRMATLSGGNQQKMVLAREVDANPELLVLENPTRGLDIRATAFMRDKIRACRDRGMAVVFYSSDIDEVIDAADRVLVVYAGTVSWSEPERTVVGAAMLGIT